jgi:NADH-quinone oxidoreductase subunit A
LSLAAAPGDFFPGRLRNSSQTVGHLRRLRVGADHRPEEGARAVQGWLSIVLLTALAAGFAAVVTTLSGFVGPHRPTPEKLAPYECGMPPVGDARERYSVKFYLVAMIFLLFDIEVAFLYPWAIALRELRWMGFLQVVLFFLILLAGYVYVWRKGVLDWGSQSSVDSRQSTVPVDSPESTVDSRQSTVDRRKSTVTGHAA